MILGDLLPAIENRFGQIPKDYLCIDTEYTGGDERTDFVMEIGHVLVRDSKVVDELNLVLDWTSFPGVDQDLLRHKLKNIKYHMGDSWRITWDVMKSEGVEAFKVLAFYEKMFSRWSDSGFIVAHNGRKADERMLRGVFNRHLNKSFVIGDNLLWDSGALYKAYAMLTSPDPAYDRNIWKLFPKRSDTLRSYCERILNCRPGPKWNLTECVESLSISSQRKVGHVAHQAVCDAYDSHLVVEKLRSLLATTVVLNRQETVIDSVKEINVVEFPPETKTEVLKNGWSDVPSPVPVADEIKPPLPEAPVPTSPPDDHRRKRGQRVI